MSEHEQCWQLLPWIANERASAPDAARAELHLRNCSECREELQLQRRLRDAVRCDDSVVLAPQNSLQKLMRRIDADDVESAATTAEVSGRRRSVRWSRWWPIAAGVQAVALAALLAAMWWQSHERLTAPRFTTLSSNVPAAREPGIRVVFVDAIGLNAVAEILYSIDAQIIAGPSEAGVYTLKLSATNVASTSIEKALAQLRSDDRVLFAESTVARSE